MKLTFHLDITAVRNCPFSYSDPERGPGKSICFFNKKRCSPNDGNGTPDADGRIPPGPLEPPDTCPALTGEIIEL